jgi:hypothetical protein
VVYTKADTVDKIGYLRVLMLACKSIHCIVGSLNARVYRPLQYDSAMSDGVTILIFAIFKV